MVDAMEIAFIGLGNMGDGTAANLLAAPLFDALPERDAGTPSDHAA